MREQFGTVGFRIRRTPGEGLHPGWEPIVVQVKRLIPGSGVFSRQLIGKGMAKVTLLCRFDSVSDYMAMQALLGRTSTLVLRHRFTNVRGRTLYEDEETWEYLDNTTLDELSKPKYEISGMVEATATFERAFDPGNGRADG